MPTVKTRIFCASSCARAESRLVMLPTSSPSESRTTRAAPSAEPAHLRDRGGERVVEPRALGELRRLREHRLDLLAVGRERQRDGRLRVEEHDRERLAGVPRGERPRSLHRRVDRPLHAVRGVDQEHRADALRRGRREHAEVLDRLAVLGDRRRRPSSAPSFALLGEREDVRAVGEERAAGLDDLDAALVGAQPREARRSRRRPRRARA